MHKTAYEMRISDWSSGVCSSDLGLRQSARRIGADLHRAAQRERNGGRNGDRIAFGGGEQSQPPSDPAVVAAIGSRSAALEPILPVESRTVAISRRNGLRAMRLLAGGNQDRKGTGRGKSVTERL